MLHTSEILLSNLHHICKMHLQTFKYQRTDTEEHHRHNPKVHGRKEIPEKPLMLIYRTAVTIYNVHQGIQLHNSGPVCIQITYIPQDGSCPHTNLKCDTDNLGQIPEKYHNSAGGITEGQYKNK